MAGILVEVHSAEAFSTGGSRMRKLFRGNDLALLRGELNLLDRIAKRDARVAASTSPRRINRVPIIPGDQGALIDAAARLKAHFNGLLALMTP